MDFFSLLYSRQEFLTPGAEETVDLIAEMVRPRKDALLLDVACGKGEAACRLARRFGCHVLAVDTYAPFLLYTSAKALLLLDQPNLVSIVCADGKQLPVPSAVFDAAYCIGAPSIVGFEECLQELVRAVKPGGYVVVSDIVWRRRPKALGPEWGWVASPALHLTKKEYASAIEVAGLKVKAIQVHPRSVWRHYFRGMLQVAAELRAMGKPAAVELAKRIEQGAEMEGRAASLFFNYATFVARKS